MRRTTILALVCATACAATACTDRRAPTVTPPATASASAAPTLSLAGCRFEIKEAWSGITTIEDYRLPHLKHYAKSYTISEQGNPRLTSWLVFHGSISCPSESTIDARLFSALKLAQTPEAMRATEDEKKTYPESLLLGNPRRVPRAPLSDPFKADTIPVAVPRSTPEGVPFWQIFPIADGETPLSLATGESSIPIEGLLKPSPTSIWRLPR